MNQTSVVTQVINYLTVCTYIIDLYSNIIMGLSSRYYYPPDSMRDADHNACVMLLCTHNHY